MIDSKFQVLAEDNAGWSVCSYAGSIELYDSNGNVVVEFDTILDAISSSLTRNMNWRA